MGVLGFLLAGHATSSFPIKVDGALSRKVAFCVEQRMTEPVLERVKVRLVSSPTPMKMETCRSCMDFLTSVG